MPSTVIEPASLRSPTWRSNQLNHAAPPRSVTHRYRVTVLTHVSLTDQSTMLETNSN